MSEPRLVLIEAFADAASRSKPVEPDAARRYMPARNVLYFQICEAFNDHFDQSFGFVEGARQSQIMVTGALKTIKTARAEFDMQGNWDAVKILDEEPDCLAVAYYEDRRESHMIRHRFNTLMSVDPHKPIDLVQLLDDACPVENYWRPAFAA